MRIPSPRAAEVLAAVHHRPGIARAQLADELALSSGLASDLVAALVSGRLLAEGEPVPSGGRGRPTRALGSHARGPVVAAAAISHEAWRVELCALGGSVVGGGRWRSPR